MEELIIVEWKRFEIYRKILFIKNIVEIGWWGDAVGGCGGCIPPPANFNNVFNE